MFELLKRNCTLEYSQTNIYREEEDSWIAFKFKLTQVSANYTKKEPNSSGKAEILAVLDELL